ncbi:aminotransferase class III-fold pyridoxal phosphate-dependent enzyme [Streptomyces boninensis]|uniref:aminotransferase class III-fold pyridoxal phosphate-dependent enzyme n=1 Tax=Streptomyces boninensis TaxID=2039455 RepID=UPI003B21C3F7
MMDPDRYALWNSPSMRTYLQHLTPDKLLVEGKGAAVRDAAGTWYLDARSGLWNVSLGYDNPRLIAAIERQLRSLPYSNLQAYGRPAAVALEAAERIVAHLPDGYGKIRFASNGSQVVEMAVLLSRYLRRAEGTPERTVVFGLWRQFHGFGATAGALTGLPYVHHQTGPLIPDVLHARGPFEPVAADRMADLPRMISDYGPERVTAVVLEPVVGEGGHVLDAEYLRTVGDFCRRHDIHVIMDEVTTGMGRVGDFTRSGQVGATPDIITLGKCLTSGYAPLSAVVLSDGIYERLQEASQLRPFLTGATNDGHPLALAAAIAVVDELADGELLAGVRARGGRLRELLDELARGRPEIAAVRGTGLMHAVEFADADGTPWEPYRVNALRLAVEARGVLVSNLAMVPAIMVIPPLIVTDGEVEQIVAALDGGLDDLASGRVQADPEKGIW